MAHYHPFRAERVAPQWRWLMKLTEKELDELWLPVRESPDRYQLICVGADRAKFQIMPSGPFNPSSENIDQYRPEER